MSRRRDNQTLDLLAWEPPSFVPAFEPEAVRAPTFRDRLALAVARTLSEAKLPRDEIAARMSLLMGERVTLNMLNNYASQGCIEHSISANRLAALCAVTGDTRPLQMMAEAMDCAVIPKNLVAAVEDAMLDDKIEQLTKRRKQKRAEWRGVR